MAEIAKLNAERWKILIGQIVGVGSSIGLVAIFVYCFFVAHFFPTGLKAGDTLFFIFAMLGISLTGMILAGYGMMIYVPWINRPTATPAGGSSTPGSIKGSDIVLFGLPIFITVATLCGRVIARQRFELEQADAEHLLDAYIIGTLALIFFVVWSWILSRNFKNMSISVLPGLLFVIATGLVSAIAPDLWPVVVFVMGILSAGLMVTLGLDLLDLPVPMTPADVESNRRKIRFACTLIFVGTLVPYAACGVSAKMLSYVMGSLGIYSDHATLIVNKAEFSKLQTTADAKGVRLYSCMLDIDNTAVSDVRIWWHGIGERSYVELGAYPETPPGSLKQEGIRVELDSAGIRKSESNGATSCVELRRGIYFDSNKSVLTPDQWAMAEPVVNEFLKSKKPGDTSVIIGYADPRPGKTESNFKLAHDRACRVHHQLAASLGANVLIDIRGDKDGLLACSPAGGAAREEACEERNRRVELRFIGSAGKQVMQSGAAKVADVCVLPKDKELVPALKVNNGNARH